MIDYYVQYRNWANKLLFLLSYEPHKKAGLCGFLNQLWHKPTCKVTEDGYKFEILDLRKSWICSV